LARRYAAAIANAPIPKITTNSITPPRKNL
jgi:hypothetical protein